MKKVILSVAQKHIDEGVKGSGNSCAVALALKDVLRPEYIPIVYYGRVQIDRDEPSRTIQHALGTISWTGYYLEDCANIVLTRKVDEFQKRFDKDKSVKPNRFQLLIYEYLLR